MSLYEIKLADGRVVEMDGKDDTEACARAADLYQTSAVAWRHPRYAIVVGCQTTD